MLAAWAFFLPIAAAAVAAGGWIVWRRPAMALPVFVIGLAFHNFIIMVLIQSGAPTAGVRAIQAWKEAYIGLLALRLVVDVGRAGGASFLRRKFEDWTSLPLGLRAFDIAALAFAFVLVVYALLPASLLPVPGPSLTQRVLSFRMFILIPVLYAFGRVWPPLTVLDRRVLATGVVTAAAAVAVLGLIELWFVPSRSWLDWGILKFNAFDGFAFRGPGGLPENFFQSTTSGLGLRRMVSTYISPLGIAYTGLLVVPLAVTFALTTRRAIWPWIAFALVVISLGLSVTRLALICLALESIVLVVVLRRRAAVAASGVALAVVVATFLVYPNFAPVVSFDLADVRPPIGAKILGFVSDDATEPGSGTQPGGTRPGGGSEPGAGPQASARPTPMIGDLSKDMVNRIVTSEDASIQAHVASVWQGAEFVMAHPFGVGLGASIPRFGTPTGPGESALFQIAAETGVVGLGLFVLLYGGLVVTCLVVASRHAADLSRAFLPAVVGVGGLALAPIVITSQVWAGFSVTFLFWWAAGAAMTLRTGDLTRPIAEAGPRV